MKKILSLLAICVMAVMSAWADETPNYLCFTAENANSTVTFKWVSGSDVMTSTDGTTFSAYTAGTTITLADVGDKVYFKGTNVTTDDSNHFTMSGTIAASGDVTSLTNGVGGDATLSESCYRGMFRNCSSLTTAPALPATTLASNCYYQMFYRCSLTTAPALPATTLASNCYYRMFYSCISLTAVPALPATTLASNCYQEMFFKCNSLNKVKVNFTDWKSSDNATKDWFLAASSKGTFYCPAGLDATTRDNSHVPSGWTVTNFTPVTLNETDETEPSFTEGTSYDVTVNRTMKANQWNTLCLPFSMTADEITAAKLGTVMKMTGIENNVVNFADATEIEAGEMYIVKPEAEVTTFAVENKTCSTPVAKAFGTDWKVNSPMYQTTISQEAGNTKYVLSNDKFYTVDQQDLAVKGFRWYITDTTGSQAKTGLSISFDGDVATAISDVDASTGSAQASAQGKFLQNGKLVIVKDGKQFNAAGQLVK